MNEQYRNQHRHLPDCQKAFSDYAQVEHVEYIAPLQNVFGIRAKKAAPKEVSFLTVEQMSSLINSPDVNSYTGFRHRVILTLLYDSGCRIQELCDITIADISLGPVATDLLIANRLSSKD